MKNNPQLVYKIPQFVYNLLGTILPRPLLLKWKRLPMNTIRWNIFDYAPIRREVM